jgi:DNA-binding NarL/FixJ family response regulator
MGIEVILADDHAIVREGIKAAMETKTRDISIVGEASSGDEVLKMAKNIPADVYILDISMPILNGIETSLRLLKRYPKSKIIILSVHDEKNFVEKALKCGAKGYILKECAIEELIRGIRDVYSNKVYLCSKISKIIVQGFLGKRRNYESGEKTTELTEREREILQLIAEGFSNKEMAMRLGLSLNTVHVHRNNIIRKLDIHRQAELVRYALKEGISEL